MAGNKPDFSLGRVDTPDVGGGLLDFADRQQKQYQIGLSNAVEADKLLRDRQRFAREQELNARQDTEYNREIGLRTARQDLSKEFLANPYAAKFGSGKETALLDKQVNDYVNGGGVINEDMAKRLQAKYEEARPFREDATNALTSQMILAGEDPTKAAQTGAALGSNLLSRVEQQAAVSANRKIEQDQYDEAAKRNKDALQLKLDIAKANQAGDKDKAELLFKQYQSIGGGGTGGGSSTASGLMETLGKIGPVDASSALAEGGPIDLARKAGYTETQIARAAGQSLDTDPTAWTWADNKLDTTMFTRNLGMQPPGSGLSKSINIRDIQAPTAEEWNSIVPNRAGYRVVDYDPKRFLEGSKGVLPELFGKDTDKPLLSEVVKGTTEKKSGDTLADRNNNYGNIKYDPKDDWIGGRKDPNSAFVKFDTPELGARALAKTIINGSAGLTIDQYINKYAPASDNNDTKSYVADVAKALNKKPEELIKSEDVPAVMKAIGKREGGNYSDDVLKEGYRLAVNPTTQDKDMLSKVLERNKKDSATSKLLQSPTSEVKYLFNKVDYKNPPSVEIRGQMDELNKQGINTKEDELAFNNLQEQYKAAKTEENIIGKPFYKMSAPELINSLLGVKTEDKPNIVKQVSDKVKLANNPNAADEEAGLEDRTLDFLPLGAFAKTKSLKTTDYDNAVIDLLKGNSKSVGLKTDDKLLNELYGNSPLATVKNISELNKTATKMTPAVRQELINYANQLRSVKNPTVEQEEMLSRIAETLRKTK